MRHWSSLLLATLLLAVPLVSCGGQSEQTASAPGTSSGQQTQGKLRAIVNRGRLICGVSGELPGFSFVNQSGEYSGLDVDVCRAIAAALFDDPQAVEFRNLNAKERFTAVQTGEVDILSRNTTWTLSRDTSVGMEFAPIVFYDGQGLMATTNSGIKSLENLRDRSVCMQIGTTHEQNLADRMRQQSIPYKPLVFEDVNAMFAAYAENRCEAVSADRSALVSRRTTLPQPERHVVLDAVLSKEPLAPAVAGGDPQWADTVRWVVYTLIEAEELGVTSQNLQQMQTSQDPNIRRFLGGEGNLGQGMGLANDFATRVIRHVGNYGEIYNRYLGPNTPFDLPRGPNNLWTKGGLMYAPPFR